MKNYCEKLNEFLDRILEKRNQNSNHKPVITTILCILAITAVCALLRYLLNNISIENSYLQCGIKYYTYIFTISLGIMIMIILILSFDCLDENCVVTLRIIFKCAFIIFTICALPVLIINFILEKIFGENNDIIFLFIYFGLKILFVLIVLSLTSFLISKFNLNLEFELMVLIIATFSYLLSISWFNIYIKFLNFENKDISEIRKAHNMISYITIFLVFIINNYILNNNAIIACAVNDAIQVITLLVLIFEERMAKCNKNNK